LKTAQEAAAWLRTPEAVRSRCAEMLQLAERGRLAHFRLARERLPDAVRYVARVTRAAYPDLAVPFHSRWRHFEVGGIDRWARLEEALAARGREELARIRTDLVVTSVLLDAGAGERWVFTEADSGQRYARSEGLALASLHLFTRGLLSADGRDPYRADAAALRHLSRDALAGAFQVSEHNPLPGLDGRLALLHRLGEALEQRPDLFGARNPRVGNLFDALAKADSDGTLSARRILHAVLEGLGTIWPGRIELAGVNLGDVWRHRAIQAPDPTDGLVPFHKLSQWLAYSLVEPLQASGLDVVDVDACTGLAEYRNGGLFVDLGVLALQDPSAASRRYRVGDELVVEWRALTVALLDELAGLVRAELGVDGESFPLARVLEGGTWRAGRELARARRADAVPPIRVESDGTVF
jgi:hypothetical protein